jgi:hypothetical protein
MNMPDELPAPLAEEANAREFDFVVAWPAATHEDGEAIKAFWRREGALADGAAIEQRLTQVVMHARTKAGDIAGVCTALPTTPPRLGQPMYFWRAFIGARWRSTQLVMALLKRSCALLEEHARTHGYPCIGVLLELENARFRQRGRAAAWFNPGFVYIGRSERNLDLRVLYFRGARLKEPADT